MYHCSFEPYTGSEKYIFVSYAHKDAEEVHPILDALAEMGFRVWYDGGIASDAYWTKVIAERLANCWAVLAFLSPDAVESENCRNEILYANERKNDALSLVELRPTVLPHELDMALYRRERTIKNNFASREALIQKLRSSEKIAACNAEASEADGTFGPGRPTAGRAKRRAELSAIEKSTKKYKDKWFEPMFLNNFEDEFADEQGATISLDDLYQGTENYLLPGAKYQGRKETLTPEQLKSRLTTSLRKGITILGAPGIGKSTLITWFCNAYPAIVDDGRIIRVCSLKDILHGAELDAQHPEETVLQGAGIREADLEDSILILDGLDEISVKEKEAFVNRLFDHWYAVDNFSLIITCRINYVNLNKLKNAYAVLQAWDESEIRTFAGYYQKASGEKVHEESLPVMYKKQAIFGIPLITYMVLASNISVKTTDDETVIYDKLFALEGGIMDRCVRVGDEEKTYEKGNSNLHENEDEKFKIKIQILDISRKMAFWMFENNPDQADIPDVFGKFPELEENGALADFYKQVHITDGEVHLEFVHRTFYEYFTADYLCTELLNIMPKKHQPFRLDSPEPLAGVLAWFYKKGSMGGEFYEESEVTKFCKAKLKNTFAKQGAFDADGELKENAYFWFEEGVAELFNRGMTTYAYQKDEQQEHNHLLDVEMKCACNLFWLLSTVYEFYRPENTKNGETKKRMFAHSHSDESCWKARDSYLRTASAFGETKFRLQYADLCSADLHSADLCSASCGHADFHNAYLHAADLRDADLVSADLVSANLRNALLNNSNLHSADLRNADLMNASLCHADLRHADLLFASLRHADMRAADLRNAYMRNMDMPDADFMSANLESADLESANLKSANLESADLQKADLRGANLYSADLRFADLREVNLYAANLSLADLNYAHLTSTYCTKDLKKSESFPNLSFGGAEFDTIYVDDKEYSRKKFFDTFQPGTDHFNY